MQRVIRSFYGAGTVLVLFSALGLWLAGCGGGSGGTSVPPVPDGGGGGGGGGAPAPTVEAFLALQSAGQTGAKSVSDSTCNTAGCHANGTKSHRAFADTAHSQAGVGCQSCHGPGGNHVSAAADQKTATILTYPNTGSDGNPNQGILDPVVCGQCHSQSGEVKVSGSKAVEFDEYDEWAASKHSEKVDSPNSSASYYGSGCPRCHSSLVRTWDMEKDANAGNTGSILLTGPPTADENIRDVKHTAACATCHDVHGDPKSDKLVRHSLKQVFSSHDAYVSSNIGPAKKVDYYTNFDHVCAECHNARGVDPQDGDAVAKTGLQGNTSRPSMHDSNQYQMLIGEGGVDDRSLSPTVGALPRPGSQKYYTAHRDIEEQCVHCHMGGGGHTWTAGNQGCSPCHSSSEAASLKSAVQSQIDESVMAVESRLDAWGSAINLEGKGASSWEYSSAGGPATQSAVPITIKRARHNYYFIVRDLSRGVHNKKYTEYLLEIANLQLDAAGAPKSVVKGSSTTSSAKSPSSGSTASSSKPQGRKQKLLNSLRSR